MKKLALLLLAFYSCWGAGLRPLAADCGQDGCSWDSAMAYCKKDGGRLPTTEELMQAWEAKCTGGRTSGLCSGWYWSSMERNSGRAWGVSFRDGVARDYKKSSRAPVHCGPRREQGKNADAGPAADAPPPSARGGNGAKCAGGRCSWYEAAAYCRSSGSRLFTVKEWYALCPVECRKGAAAEDCKNYFWLGESENADYAYSGTCAYANIASAHSVLKTSLSYARCAK